MRFDDIRNNINKVLLFILPVKQHYWNSITKCNIEEKPVFAGKYYLNFISKYDYPLDFDQNGIPLYRKKNMKSEYHPIVIAQYALGIYEKLNYTGTGKNSLINKFLTQADWFRNNLIEVKSKYYWYINYDIPEYKIISPWYSAMAQGEAVSVLVRAFILTGEKDYLSTSEKAIQVFFSDVKDGGVVNYFDKHIIYEEYPSPERTVGVLNGFIFSLFGIFDLYLATKNHSYHRLFQKGADSLKDLLEVYDMEYWSQYYLFDHPQKYPASFTYHKLVIEQLKVLHILTGEKIFSEYSDKWNIYSRKLINRIRVLLHKLLN
ncbi:MAG: hypothetical protein Kow0098_16970 [Ignavibacteriaceae bacterium]